MKKLVLFVFAIFAFVSCVKPPDIGRFLESESVQTIINRNENCKCECDQEERGQ